MLVAISHEIRRVELGPMREKQYLVVKNDYTIYEFVKNTDHYGQPFEIAAVRFKECSVADPVRH